MSDITDSQILAMLRQLDSTMQALHRQSGSTGDGGISKASTAVNAAFKGLSQSAATMATTIKNVNEVLDDHADRVQSDRDMDVLNKRLSLLSGVTSEADMHMHDLVRSLEQVKQQNQSVVAQSKKDAVQNRWDTRKTGRELRDLQASYRSSVDAVHTAALDQAAAIASREQAAQQAQAAIDARNAHVATATVASSAALSALNAAVTTTSAALVAATSHADAVSAALDATVASTQPVFEKQAELTAKMGELTRATSDRIKAETTATANIDRASKEQARVFVEIGKGALTFSNVLKKSIDGIAKVASEFGVALGATAIANAGKQMYEQAKAEINTGTNIGNIDGKGTSLSYLDTAAMGMNPAEFVQATAEYRRAMLSAGGLAGSMDLLKESSSDLKDVIADPKERMEFMLHNMEMLSKNGIVPTSKTMGSMNKVLHENIVISGEAAAQFMGHIRDMVDDDSVQQQLRAAASADERKSILEGIQTRYAENKAMGMTADQAKAVTKSMAALAGEGPLERLKKSYKLQAAMGAMGVAGGARAAELVRKGQHISPAEKAELQGLMSNYQNKMSTSFAGSGPAAFMAEQIGAKTGWDNNSTAAYNTNMLKEVAKPIKEAGAEMAQGIHKAGGAIVNSVNAATQAYSQATNNPYMELGLGITGLVTANWANTAAVTANTAAQMKSSIASLFSGGLGGKLAGVAKGGLLAIGGLALTTAGDAATESGHNNLGAGAKIAGRTAEFAGTGAMLGSVIPGLGTAAGAGIGATIGAGYGLYENWGKFGSNSNEQQKLHQARIKHDKKLAAANGETPADTVAKSIDTMTTTAGVASIDFQMQQIQRADKTNEYLRAISDGVPTLIDLANKQLTVSTLSEDEKKSRRKNITHSSGFSASSYQYI